MDGKHGGQRVLHHPNHVRKLVTGGDCNALLPFRWKKAGENVREAIVGRIDCDGTLAGGGSQPCRPGILTQIAEQFVHGGPYMVVGQRRQDRINPAPCISIVISRKGRHCSILSICSSFRYCLIKLFHDNKTGDSHPPEVNFSPERGKLLTRLESVQ